MRTAANLIAAVLDAFGAGAESGVLSGEAPQSTPAPGDALRVLAVLELATRQAIDDAAASIAGSPVRAAALAQLTERIYRAGSYGQVVAAGACVDTEVHTLTEDPLAELNRLIAAPYGFATGTAVLPQDAVTGPDHKPLHHDPAEFLKSQLHLGYFQARHRVNTHERLMEHHGPDGTTLPPACPQLAAVFADGTADPRQVANAAAKFITLNPAIEAQPDPELTKKHLESQVAKTLRTADEAGVAKFIKQAGIKLETAAIELASEHLAQYLGLRYRGHKPTGYLWEFTVDAEGHELLSTLADDLNNPRTASGKPRRTVAAPAQLAPKSSSARVTESEIDTADLPELIPAWAVSPDMPLAQRPRAGFSDLGQNPAEMFGTYPYPGFPSAEPLPGESLEAANSRMRAQLLSQAVLDSIRSSLDPENGKTNDPDMPMKSRVELLVMIDYTSLVGISQKPGFTQRGEIIPAGEARRLACNAGILPLVLGGESQPLDLGRRRRFFSKGQKRAITARDRGCSNPGCSMPAHRCEVHHIKPFSEGGKTNTANGLLLCIRCHTAFHAGHFTIRVDDAVPRVILPKSRDPLQRPMRNWVFHPEAAAA